MVAVVVVELNNRIVVVVEIKIDCGGVDGAGGGLKK